MESTNEENMFWSGFDEKVLGINPDEFKDTKKPQPGHVYFAGVVSGYIKIGHTTGDLAKRLSALQVGSWEKIHLYGHLYCENPRDVEQSFHVILAEQKMQGEWFCVAWDEIIRVAKRLNLHDSLYV